MSVTNLILFIALVGSVASYNEVVLKPWQTNLTTNSGAVVALGSYANNARMMMAAAGNILYFWRRAKGEYFDSPPQEVSLNTTILDAKISQSGINVAVIGNTTKLYFLAKQNDNYTLTQTIELTVLPTAMTWGFNS